MHDNSQKVGHIDHCTGHRDLEVGTDHSRDHEDNLYPDPGEAYPEMENPSEEYLAVGSPAMENPGEGDPEEACREAGDPEEAYREAGDPEVVDPGVQNPGDNPYLGENLGEVSPWDNRGDNCAEALSYHTPDSFLIPGYYLGNHI